MPFFVPSLFPAPESRNELLKESKNKTCRGSLILVPRAAGAWSAEDHFRAQVALAKRAEGTRMGLSLLSATIPFVPRSRTSYLRGPFLIVAVTAI